MAALMAGLSQAESDLLTHINHWGSVGYPVRKQGRRWKWEDAWGVKGPPITFKTKREAVAAFERWIALKLEEHGEAVRAEAIAATNARTHAS